jgi:2-hydroxy-3-keto-5-methylthiopentenyl-1-phosphate phosphatase
MTQITAIYAAEIDTSSEYLRVYSNLENDFELVAKVQAMAKYSATETIAIGDSVTDINMALQADLVFAGDALRAGCANRLSEYLEAEKKPYIRWHNFLDVRDYLAAYWN